MRITFRLGACCDGGCADGLIRPRPAISGAVVVVVTVIRVWALLGCMRSCCCCCWCGGGAPVVDVGAASRGESNKSADCGGCCCC